MHATVRWILASSSQANPQRSHMAAPTVHPQLVSQVDRRWALSMVAATKTATDGLSRDKRLLLENPWAQGQPLWKRMVNERWRRHKQICSCRQ